jgi:hypothetical protein
VTLLPNGLLLLYQKYISSFFSSRSGRVASGVGRLGTKFKLDATVYSPCSVDVDAEEVNAALQLRFLLLSEFLQTLKHQSQTQHCG